jgi:hypothetical protein
VIRAAVERGATFFDTNRVRLRRDQAGPVIRHSLTISLGGGVM